MGGEIGSLCTCTSSYQIRGRSTLRIRKAETKFDKGKSTEFGENSQVWKDVGGVASLAVSRNSGSDHRSRVQNGGRVRSHAPDRELSGKGSSSTFLPSTYPLPTSSPARQPLHRIALALCSSYCGPHCAHCTGQLLIGTMRRRLALLLGLLRTGGAHVADLACH